MPKITQKHFEAGGENTLQNICGLYVSVNDDGAIKRNLTVKNGETIKLKNTTVNDEIIAFSELNFKYYAELLEHIENTCEKSFVEITDGDFGEAGIDVDAYAEILQTVHKLIEALEESNPLHGTLLRTLLEDQIPPDDGSAMYLINSEAKITDCLSSVMKLQFLINDILYDCGAEHRLIRKINTAFLEVQSLRKYRHLVKKLLCNTVFVH